MLTLWIPDAISIRFDFFYPNRILQSHFTGDLLEASTQACVPSLHSLTGSAIADRLHVSARWHDPPLKLPVPSSHSLLCPSSTSWWKLSMVWLVPAFEAWVPTAPDAVYWAQDGGGSGRQIAVYGKRICTSRSAYSCEFGVWLRQYTFRAMRNILV